MISYSSQYQTKITEFSNLYQLSLDAHNRWIQLGSIIPWDKLASICSKKYNLNQGSSGVNLRMIIGSLIVKHKLNLTDEETLAIIQENPYMQFFLGLETFNPKPIFSPSLFVELRKRFGQEVFYEFNDLIIKCTHTNSDKSITHKGELKIDATVADQYITYPNDIDLLNDARKKTEEIIDLLYDLNRGSLKVKPRTYRRDTDKVYQKAIKKKKKTKSEVRKTLRCLLNCVKRNLGHIDKMLDLQEANSNFPLAVKYLKRLWVIRWVYEQQWKMFIEHKNSCKDRIVSISQPHVRPIVRGKQRNYVEFGAKLGLGVFDGYLMADTLSWDAYNESDDLIKQAENYRKILGYYPKTIFSDKIYWTNKNRLWCKEKRIKLLATPKGRPKAKTPSERRKEKKEFAKRNHVEGKIGNAKQAYNLNQIKAKLKSTSESWIGAIIFVVNLGNFANLMNSSF